jgi:hypothetical protein
MVDNLVAGYKLDMKALSDQNILDGIQASSALKYAGKPGEYAPSKYVKEAMEAGIKELENRGYSGFTSAMNSWKEFEIAKNLSGLVPKDWRKATELFSLLGTAATLAKFGHPIGAGLALEGAAIRSPLISAVTLRYGAPAARSIGGAISKSKSVQLGTLESLRGVERAQKEQREAIGNEF